MKEVLKKNDIILRENFGPGNAGEMAFLTISHGTPCESKITHKEKQDLPLADRTIGFDVSANYEFVAVCSDTCEAQTKKVIERDLLNAGQLPSFDRNGFGRA